MNAPHKNDQKTPDKNPFDKNCGLQNLDGGRTSILSPGQSSMSPTTPCNHDNAPENNDSCE